MLTRFFFYPILPFREAGIAQLVEYKLPKLGVASSNLVARSTDMPFSRFWLEMGRAFMFVGLW